MREIRAPRFEIFVIALLVAVICQRVWGLGIVNHDDAEWALRAYQSGQPDAPHEMAVSEGRLWGLPIGNLMLFGLARQGTAFGEFLKIGSFTLFFAAFYFTVATYFGTRIAVVAAILFCALYEVRWDGSILTAYPLLIWPTGTVFLGSILSARWYGHRGGMLPLCLSIALLWLSLWNNEGLVVTFAALFLACVVVAYAQVAEARRAVTLLFGAVIAILAYAGPSLAWLYLHPSGYHGHVLAPFDWSRFSRTLFHFVTSGSVVHDFLEPYSVRYLARSVADVGAADYSIFDSARTITASPTALLVGLLTVGVLWKSLPDRVKGERPWLDRSFAIVFGLVLAIVPLAVVSMTEKYQHYVIEFGVRSHYMTILAHFGLSLVAASLIIAFLDLLRRLPVLSGVAVGVIALGGGALAALSSHSSDVIVADMRPEAARWRVLAQTVDDMQTLSEKRSIIWASRFGDGSWFAVLPADYWSAYAKARYGRDVEFRTGDLTIDDIKRGMVAVDYQLDRESRGTITTIVELSQKDAQPKAERIMVDIEKPTESELNDYWLSYADRSGTFVHKRLSELATYDDLAGLRYVADIDAPLASVSIRRGSPIGSPLMTEKSGPPADKQVTHVPP
jgi:hypothetical protein